MVYDTTKTYPSFTEAQIATDSLRPLWIGDKITVNRITLTIKEVSYSDIFVEKEGNDEYVVYFMCEFIAQDGGYGYYKSFFDGGTVELME